MTSRGAEREREKTGRTDVMGWQQFHTIEPRRAPPPRGYLCQTNKRGGQRQTNAWHVSLLTEWQLKPPRTLGKHSWPRPPLPHRPLPYPTPDPTLRAICRSAPCRQPHDLIKCNYHQPLVLGGRGGVNRGETSCSRETNNIQFFAHFFRQFLGSSTLQERTRPHITPHINHGSEKEWKHDTIKISRSRFCIFRVRWLFKVKSLVMWSQCSLKKKPKRENK